MIWPACNHSPLPLTHQWIHTHNNSNVLAYCKDLAWWFLWGAFRSLLHCCYLAKQSTIFCDQIIDCAASSCCVATYGTVDHGASLLCQSGGWVFYLIIVLHRFQPSFDHIYNDVLRGLHLATMERVIWVPLLTVLYLDHEDLYCYCMFASIQCFGIEWLSLWSVLCQWLSLWMIPTAVCFCDWTSMPWPLWLV